MLPIDSMVSDIRTYKRSFSIPNSHSIRNLPSDNNSILVVSAWLPEQRIARAVVTNTNFQSAEFAQPYQTTELEKSTFSKIKLPSLNNVYFTTTGIGAIRAAAIVTRALVEKKYSKVIFCGTAGYYPQHHIPIGTVVESSSVICSDIGLISNRSYLPLQKTLTGFSVSQVPDNSVCCVTTPSITQGNAEANFFGTLGQIENLEFYGVALAAFEFGIPWLGLFGISNCVGENSHSEWESHHLSASIAAQNVLLKCLYPQNAQEI